MEVKEVRNKQLKFYRKNITKDYIFRMKALNRLEYGIRSHEKHIISALKKDLNKSAEESYMTEIGMALRELSYMKRNLWRFMMVKHKPVEVSQMVARGFVQPEPYGVVLIMSPWNYPFLLTISPLIGAIAAGNCCMIKPSEESVHTSNAVEDMIKDIFPEEYVAVVQGDRKVSEQILNLRYDYIFFTGSPRVGKIVMRRASKYLTPVTLELGGKSPCIIDETADLDLAAKKIVFGKILNAGQTCIAPDYILIQDNVKQEFVEYMKKWLLLMLGREALENKDYPSIINQKQYKRLLHLLLAEEENILLGGKVNDETLKIEPTLVEISDQNSKLMKEEIFGPILPMMSFHHMSEAETFVSKREKPLALYLFTSSKEVEKRILQHLSFGGGCINDTIFHGISPHMAFGGVGASGMGSYHGKHSFETFSHQKAVLKKYPFVDMPIRYHPYSEKKDLLIRKFLK
ncbi:MAG TPA: aldehyde dehydrogenase [Candidatus Merdenecus merdavium]|nr:aldehyde dehydrogenase [Candidatus Merdenecus merdavium]